MPVGSLLSLDPSVAKGIRAASAAVQDIVDNDKVVYGINTGFRQAGNHAHQQYSIWPNCNGNLVLSPQRWDG